MDNKSSWFIFQKDQLLLQKGKSGMLLPQNALSLEKYFLRHISLGKFNDRECYCVEVPENITLPADMEWVPLRKTFELLGKDWYRPTARAYQIINWDKNHQFCGHCGSKTTHKIGTYERICDNCGLVLYPRISPSIIVRIKKDDQILMARSPHFAKGIYALIAGFVEVGESIEETVHREVYEETGIKIKNLKYFDSQPWPFPDSLMIGFTADYASGELVIDHKELEDAGWYRYDNLPGRPASKISISSRLIDDFITEQMQHSKNNEAQNGSLR